MKVALNGRLKQALLALPRRRKQLLVILGDVLAAWAAMWLAFTLRLETWHVPTLQQLWVYAAAPLIFVPIFARFGLYRAIFRYTGLATLQTMLKAALVYGAILLGLVLLTFPAGVPRSVGVLQPVLFFLLVSNARAWARFWLSAGSRRAQTRRLLIYGAGSAGAQTAAAIRSGNEFALLGFVDDDAAKVGRSLNGLEVYPSQAVPELIARLGVTDILLAIPSMSRSRRHQIIEQLRPLPVHVRTLPGMADLAAGTVTVSDFQELDLEDLLGRDPVPPNPALLARDLAGKTVMVTGAGGSIGSELCRQIVRERPSRLVLVEHNEFGLYSIHQELESLLKQAPAGGEARAGAADQPPGKRALAAAAGHGAALELVPVLASVRDVQRMTDICRAYRPDTVYHAAAYKHVPIVEHNACEGVSNNVIGTLNVARAAMEAGAAAFVLVSTDKAVRPTNIMGASKRLAELVLQALAAETMVRFDDHPPLAGLVRNRTRFCMVRFGNVLGSSGSVVPLFRRQIEAGGPVTLTHPEVTRYFMTIPEASQLVLQAGAMGQGGEVFVLDMGQPVKIIDLARRMVQLSGLRVRDDAQPDGDIEIAVTGMRPGEKLYEELLIGDNPEPTAHPRIMKAREEHLEWDVLRGHLKAIENFARANDVVALRGKLARLVSGYRAEGAIVDWVAVSRRG